MKGKELKKFLAGLGIASLVAGAGLGTGTTARAGSG